MKLWEICTLVVIAALLSFMLGFRIGYDKGTGDVFGDELSRALKSPIEAREGLVKCELIKGVK